MAESSGATCDSEQRATQKRNENQPKDGRGKRAVIAVQKEREGKKRGVIGVWGGESVR